MQKLMQIVCGAGFAAILFAAGCASGPTAGRNKEDKRGLDQLASWMTGVFTSEAQSKGDVDFMHVRLVMAPIWTDRTDGKWLYVEQAMATSLDRPYRQRVYRLEASPGGGFQSSVYLIPGDPLKYAGAWQRPNLLADLTPDRLQEREGCEIMLRRDAKTGNFVGGTVGANCPSERAGATYASSEVTISETMLMSWDRGFDASGKQVWGAEKGGYRFEKLGR